MTIKQIHIKQKLIGKLEYATLQEKLDKSFLKKLSAYEHEFLPDPEYIKRWGYQVDSTGTIPYME